MKKRRIVKRMVFIMVGVMILAGSALLYELEKPRIYMYGDNLKEYVDARIKICAVGENFADEHLGDTDDEIKNSIEEHMSKFKYDYEGSYNNVYDGITYHEMECRGYAAYAYALWRACGYDVSIVVAQKDHRQHAYIKVKLHGQYQYIDYSVLGQKAKHAEDPTTHGYVSICEYGKSTWENLKSDIQYRKWLRKVSSCKTNVRKTVTEY